MRRGRARTTATTHCRDAGQHEWQPEAGEGGEAPGQEGADGSGAPDDAPGGGADPAHRLGGRQPLAQGDRHHCADADGEAHHCVGGAGQLPALRHGHDQVARAGEDGGADQGLGALESPDQHVRHQAAQQAADGTGREEEPVGARADPPHRRGEQDEDAGLHPLQAGQ